LGLHSPQAVYGLPTSWLSPTFDDAGGIGLMAVHRAMAAESASLPGTCFLLRTGRRRDSFHHDSSGRILAALVMP
jgi:hypothetical protein